MLEKGTMTLGVNYWASHAATRMWTQWDAAVVEKDLAALEKIGCRLLRVFPIWPDFQPVMVLRSNCAKGGYPRAYAFTGERPLPATEAGRAGVDETMMERFETLADLAQRHGMKLIVPLINGHMTFRVYCPPAVDGLDAFTDPESLFWQNRFVRYFVKRMKHHPAILAWELGNESNCLSVADTRAAAWNWAAQISASIRLADPSRPVYSGMHSLQLHDRQWETRPNKWLLADQAELCDMLTTHPYQMWRSYVNCDSPNTLRWVMLAPTENRLYADIGGKPAIVEEIGTLRRTFSDFPALGRQLRNILWLLWASDARALLWWCAFDQTGMEFPPYDWDEAGMEHGILTGDRRLNPTGEAIAAFGDFLRRSPVQSLPPAAHTAVCIFGRDQEHYELANASNILARQAGLTLKFAFCEEEIPEAPCYFLPCLKRKGGLNRAAFRELSRRVEAGATLCVTLDSDASPVEMAEFFGAEIVSRRKGRGPREFSLQLGGKPIVLRLAPPHEFTLAARGASPLDESGTFMEFRRGRGRVILAALPLEKLMLEMPGSFQMFPACEFYRYCGAEALSGELLHADCREVLISEHPESERRCYAVIANCSPEARVVALNPAAGWRITGCDSDSPDVVLPDGSLALPENGAALLVLERQL